MGVRHIKMYEPPWVPPLMFTMCGRPIGDNVRVATAQQIRADLAADRGAMALPGLPAEVDIVDLLSDQEWRKLCRRVDACQPCLKRSAELRPWDRSPLRCMAQYAAFVAEHSDPAVRIKALAYLLAEQQLTATYREEFDRTAGREQRLAALAGTVPR